MKFPLIPVTINLTSPARKLLLVFFSAPFLFSVSSCKEVNDPRSSEQALASFELEEGFQIELIAAEPLISDPVDMEIDEFGRMYVVEMHGYPLDKSGSGKVKLLSDTDGDGQMDQSTVFADSLILPTGIMRWKKGVLVTDPPNVYYLEDTDGDSKADRKEIVLTGFAVSNPQHNVNSPRLGLDNWIYLGHESAVTTKMYHEEFGDRGSEVFFPSNSLGVRLPQNAGGRSIRFKPEGYQLEALASRTQFGHTFDDWGNRFVVNNSNHVIQDVMDIRYLNRNPLLLLSESTQSISDHGTAAEVFPITVNPEHQLLTDRGVITSACGITAYLGGAFSSPFDQAIFVAEPVSNLVHVDLLSSKGVTFSASRQHPDKEFLASRDSWFRPVNMYVGPDGAMYVLDYYRKYIEHPEWMAEEVVNSGALYDGSDKGRIYRITPKGTPSLDWSDRLDMGDWPEERLVEKLDDTNSWWRRNAQRLLLDRKPQVLPENLIELAQNLTTPKGRVHALWTLEGLGQLRPEWIIAALTDPEPGVRANAIRLAELHLKSNPELVQAILAMKTEQDPKVRFQLLCTLGNLDQPEVVQLRKDLLFKDLNEPWMQVAALSAPFEQSRQLMDGLLEGKGATDAGYASLLQRLSAMTGASLEQDRIFDLISKGTSPSNAKAKPWQAPLLKGLSLGIQSKKVTAETFTSFESLLVPAVFEHPDITVRQAALELLGGIGSSGNLKNTERARKLAENRALTESERVLGVNFLALHQLENKEVIFQQLIRPTEPLPVQLAAVKGLGKIQGLSSARYFLEHWPTLTPELREAALQTLMGSEERIDLLLQALEKGEVQVSNLGWRRSVSLMNHAKESLRTRARKVINQDGGKGEKIVEDYQSALQLKGDQNQGKTVYQNNCASCHKMGEELGLAFGPDLSSLKNRTASSVMNDILVPGLSIADGYDLWSIELKNGESLQGIIGSETPSTLQLRISGGQERSISRQDIQHLIVLENSAMPNGLDQSINHQEMADLLSFILKIK